MRTVALITALFVFSFFAMCGRYSGPVEEVYFLMDTMARISIYDTDITKSAIQDAASYAVEEMKRVEQLLSVHIDSSEAAKINRNAGKKALMISKDIECVIEESMKISETSSGAFDITIGPLKKLWNFESNTPTVPDSESICSVLKTIGYGRLKISDGKIFLQDAGMEIDLGGIAKGYIIDSGIRALKRKGIKSAIIEAGGDLRILGKKPDKGFWRIGIRHPRGERNGLIGILRLEGGSSVATSGDYERYFFKDRIRYHHILNPRTGYPARGCISVTIVADNCMVADGYATAVFVLGPKKGMELIENVDSIEGVIIYEKDEELEFLASDGIKDKIDIK